MTVIDQPITGRTFVTTELDDFPALTERYERELLAHCYRMSGSVHEAEDLAQEALLRAWKASASFPGRSSGRARRSAPGSPGSPPRSASPTKRSGPAGPCPPGSARLTRWPATPSRRT